MRLAFGLLDLLDEYWVTYEIRIADDSAEVGWSPLRPLIPGGGPVRCATGFGRPPGYCRERERRRVRHRAQPGCVGE
ncbi:MULTISPECIES: hypothetical protein [unclassified Streptomyces]|uniref:hypothetical protein n=1 Tax=unclassified Streptomyces TaxID=2593676 RepID=UPI002E11D5F5|nr:hypothetical protein OG457_44960 [Streptomyces sp. NBC_01207]WTA23963.1 hypothetical protein OG365_38625 [Streptomyces sp. NBC_00853]